MLSKWFYEPIISRSEAKLFAYWYVFTRKE